jgi:hypothetical protein
VVKEQALHPTLVNGTNLHPLRAKCLELYTQREPIVLMHADCPVARSEGLTARAQVEPGDAYQKLSDAGPAAIVSTNSVQHPSNGIEIGEVLSGAVIEVLKNPAPSAV